MKRSFKKSVSFFLAFLMIISSAAVAFSAFAAEKTCDCEKIPVIYVTGRQAVYNDPSSPDKYEVPNDTTEKILEVAKPCMKELAAALVTDKWDSYCDALVEAVLPFYEEYRLNPDGTKACPTSGTAQMPWGGVTVPDNHKNDDIMAYHYWSDPRMDPWDNADDFNAFIKAVKKATGHSKVSIDARCLGTTTVMSYMVKYGRENNFEDISSCVLYNGTMNGIAMAGKLFAGNLYLDPEGVGRFATDYLAASALERLIGSTVTLSQEVGLVDVGTNIVDYIYQKVYQNALPRILKGTYGSTFGYWSMVSDEYFEDAIALNYSQKEQEGEYKDFIAKIRNYHYNVQAKNFETLKMMKESGVNTAVIAKYGYQIVPVSKDSDQMGDNRIDLYDQSFGATAAPVSKTFSDDYINSVAAENKRYISPDRQVDASTCVLPESTWFIKNLDHIEFPACVDALMMKILRSKTQVTVDSFPEYPQFLLYTGETGFRTGDGKIVPLTVDNGNTQQKYKENKKSAFFGWISDFFTLALSFVSKFFAKIKALFS